MSAVHLPETRYAIVGAGCTGLLLLLLLTEVGHVAPETIAILDPHFDGGDLLRRWGPVQSNTPWSKTAAALRRLLPSIPLSDPAEPEATTPLADLAHLIRRLAAPILRRTQRIQGVATVVDWNQEKQHWSVETQSGLSITSRTLLLAQGSEPRCLNLPIPSIPLETALDPGRLRTYDISGKTVLVFGTMHSGTLVIRNVLEAGAASVTALYNTEQPFVWDRDGAYDGIKAEAATIADAIVAAQPPFQASKLCLAHIRDTETVLRAGATADWVLYAMGFRTRQFNTPFSLTDYDGATGRLTAAPGPAYGFGVAYPNRAPDGVHWDVSLAAFLEHMHRQLPTLLSHM